MHGSPRKFHHPSHSTTQSSVGGSLEPFEVNEASLRIVFGVKVMIKCHVTRRYNSTALNQRYESQTQTVDTSMTSKASLFYTFGTGKTTFLSSNR